MSVLRDSVASEQLQEGSLLFNDESASRPNTRYDTVYSNHLTSITSMDFRYSITVLFKKFSCQIHVSPECVLKSEIFSDFKHINVWISDINYSGCPKFTCCNPDFRQLVSKFVNVQTLIQAIYIDFMAIESGFRTPWNLDTKSSPKSGFQTHCMDIKIVCNKSSSVSV